MPAAVLDDTKKRQIIELYASGAGREEAATIVGCHPRTIINTAKRDPEFLLRIRQASQSIETRLRRTALDIAESGKNWKATKWLLERYYPQRYGPIKPNHLSVEQVEALLCDFSDAIVSCVTDMPTRRRILARFDEILASLSDTPREEDSIEAVLNADRKSHFDAPAAIDETPEAAPSS